MNRSWRERSPEVYSARKMRKKNRRAGNLREVQDVIKFFDIKNGEDVAFIFAESYLLKLRKGPLSFSENNSNGKSTPTHATVEGVERTLDGVVVLLPRSVYDELPLDCPPRSLVEQ